MKDLLTICQLMNARGNLLPAACDAPPAEVFVMASDRPGVFMLGGDLDLFATVIERQERETLRRYGHTCVDLVHNLFNHPSHSALV